jgi:nitrogen fixation/metabolism regulation signal transduction histidine kinase
MDTVRGLRCGDDPTKPAEPTSTDAPGPITIDRDVLRRVLHDLRSPMTVLVCNRGFLEEALAPERAAIDRALVDEILSDDASAVARIERAVAMLESLAREPRPG